MSFFSVLGVILIRAMLYTLNLMYKQLFYPPPPHHHHHKGLEWLPDSPLRADSPDSFVSEALEIN